jgi:FkbM family methyltransferase
MHELLKAPLKSIRDCRLVNHLATSLTKTVFDLLDAAYPDFVIRHLPRCGNVRASLPNGSVLRLWSRGDDWVANQVYWRGWASDEPEALPLFYALAKQADVILDIGAHVGLYSLVASYANGTARVFAFEPLPRARDRLISNIDRNGRSSIEVISHAVSDRCGRHHFYCVNEGLPGIPSSSSLSREFMTQTLMESELSCLEVEVTTIDEFCKERGITKVDLAKLDVESLEPQAIEGMRKSIERGHPHLFVEILQGKGTEGALDSLARQFAYNVFALDPEGPQFQPHIVVDARRRNYLFTRMSPEELHHFMTSHVPARHKDRSSITGQSV